MSRTVQAKCDRCAATSGYREGGDQLPKGWVRLRLTPSSTQKDRDMDLCEECARDLEAALKMVNV